MKLGKKYRNFWLSALFVVLVLGAFLQHIVYSDYSHHITDDLLDECRQDIELYAQQCDSTLDKIELSYSYVRLDEKPIDRIEPAELKIRDTTIINPFQPDDPVIYRMIRFPVQTAQKKFMVTLALPTLEEDELLIAVTMASVGLFILIVGVSFIALRYMSRQLTPLHQMLHKVRTYNFRYAPPRKLEQSQIDEFDELSDELYELFTRMHYGYNSLKELIENTSHELQTPLAVIRMKLERLEQICNTDEQMLAVSEMHDALRRLSQFNHSLLIIARISNDRFYQKESVDLTEYINKYLTDFEEYLQLKGIGITKNLTHPFVVELHPTLATILVNNLMSNAVKHNIPAGNIRIASVADSLIIENDCHTDQLPEGEDWFKRYIRNNRLENSTGIGLAIVREICDRNHIAISATVKNHRFVVEVSRG